MDSPETLQKQSGMDNTEMLGVGVGRTQCAATLYAVITVGIFEVVE